MINVNQDQAATEHSDYLLCHHREQDSKEIRGIYVNNEPKALRDRFPLDEPSSEEVVVS